MKKQYYIQKAPIYGSNHKEFLGSPETVFQGIPGYKDPEDQYFQSYSHFGIHEEMIKDKVRTGSYMNAIKNNPHLFQGKIVLDVGCGTGILSMFAAQAGAAHVYGIDMAEIADKAVIMIKDNNLQDKITIIKGKVEEIELPVQKVDIIISEWMGYFLLYESMLDTVLVARDKWLVEGGLIFPDVVRLMIAGIEDAKFKEEKLDFWKGIYNIDMSVMRNETITEPLVDYVEPQALLTSSSPILELNLKTCTLRDYEFVVSQFTLVANRKDYVHALVAWFDVKFSDCSNPVIFSTGPRVKTTHWKQTVFYIEGQICVNQGDKISGDIALRKNPKSQREIEIKLALEYNGQYPYFSEQFYRLR